MFFTITMKELLFIALTIIIGLIPLKVSPTHIVGGEMYYEHISGNQYKITLIVYRDCFNGIPGFDNPAYVAVFDSAFNRIKNILVPAPFPDTIPLQNYDSCTWVDTVCYEVAKYEFIDSFPPIKGGYILAYDRCCWNFSVINIVNPDVVYLGQKDYQQTVVIKKIVRDLNINTIIKVMPTVREHDGLALSSRNSYLSENERRDAVILRESLERARGMFHNGERNASRIINEMSALISSKPSVRADYIKIIDPETLLDKDDIMGRAVVALAAYVGKTRLIDNIILKEENHDA